VTEQDNVKIVKKIYEEFNRRDLDALMDYLADDVTYVCARGIVYDKKGVHKLFDSLLESFPDCKMRVDRIVSQGNTVIVEYGWSATHTRKWAGIPPTNKKFEMPGVEIYDFQAGKVKLWKDYSKS